MQFKKKVSVVAIIHSEVNIGVLDRSVGFHLNAQTKRQFITKHY